ncbi:MAG: UDP-N-acetylmuramoyl-L-alanine--D-glutamate ligase [Treponema sp.]|jgi:UDP-N-acetylmuramoylalanine--D-glutamate ligase|nr:UDP-N-acetylmuramoyl-L-alanine--D-glutamate ligase [Treponema sp.]
MKQINCAFRSLSDIKGKKITVMGLGLNHGGEAAARFFLNHGATVTVTDMKTPEELAPAVKALQNDPEIDQSCLRFVLGGHEAEDFSRADVVIKNPGIKYEGNQFLAVAKAIETDISVFLALTKAPIIAVTGSKGKSTTVSAIHYGLCEAGFRAFLGGNITVSPLTFLEQTAPDTPVVLELSSWQLADLRGRGVLRPKIALITPIFPDHQNWYNGMEPYVADKRLIYADQTPDDWTICQANDPWGDLFAVETRARVIRYPSAAADVYLNDLLVPGAHARQNVQNAALVLSLRGVNPDEAARILSHWHGIPHRLEYFHTWTFTNPAGGLTAVWFYNDSAATVPEATAAASQAFGRPVHLLCGGTDKQLDFAPLADALAGQTPDAIPAASIHLLAGTGTDKLIPLLKNRGVAYNGPFASLDSLLASLQKNLTSQTSGNLEEIEEIVVFSPGATSFGMFKNEFDRGERFKIGATGAF